MLVRFLVGLKSWRVLPGVVSSSRLSSKPNATKVLLKPKGLMGVLDKKVAAVVLMREFQSDKEAAVSTVIRKSRIAATWKV